MSPLPHLTRDLARLLGLLSGRRLDALTDRERLALARIEARLILRRHIAGVYPVMDSGLLERRRPEPSEN